MNKKLLCFDLDETLLRSDKSVSTFTLQILCEWKNRGGLIAFATARARMRVLDYMSKVNLDGLVALRGAFVYNKDTLIKEFCIDDEIVFKLQNLCIENNDCYMSVFLEDKILTNFPPFLNHGDCEFCDFSKIKLEKVGKILFLTEKYLSKDILYLLNSCRYTKDPIYSSYSIYNTSANKINSLKYLCTELGIDLNDVYCFGNDDNDIEMLNQCGKGIAVANSTENLLAIADEICLSNDEDGPANWIKENLL